jgi:hypothetical protein
MPDKTANVESIYTGNRTGRAAAAALLAVSEHLDIIKSLGKLHAIIHKRSASLHKIEAIEMK